MCVNTVPKKQYSGFKNRMAYLGLMAGISHPNEAVTAPALATGHADQLQRSANDHIEKYLFQEFVTREVCSYI